MRRLLNLHAGQYSELVELVKLLALVVRTRWFCFPDRLPDRRKGKDLRELRARVNGYPCLLACVHKSILINEYYTKALHFSGRNLFFNRPQCVFVHAYYVIRNQRGEKCFHLSFAEEVTNFRPFLLLNLEH